MAEYAPDALKWLGSRLRPDLRGELSGIVGDSAHVYGYHRARNRLPSSDYSVRLTEDRRGDSSAAAGIDMSFSDSLMRLYTARLKTAADRNDPRLKYFREFYGTLDSRAVYGRTHDGTTDGTWERSSADSSHLWHIHLSVLREYANNRSVMQGLLDILLGKPLPIPPEPEEEDMPTVMTETLPSDESPLVFALPPVGLGSFRGKRLYLSAVAVDADTTVRVAVNNGSGYVTKTVALESDAPRQSLWGEFITAANSNGLGVTVRRQSGDGEVSVLIEIV